MCLIIYGYVGLHHQGKIYYAKVLGIFTLLLVWNPNIVQLSISILRSIFVSIDGIPMIVV